MSPMYGVMNIYHPTWLMQAGLRPTPLCVALHLRDRNGLLLRLRSGEIRSDVGGKAG
ncbi:MAG: hypothetical protein KTR18_07135 [Acidiferrobacterales bacterium]|nr:hypothetical protein [Acidiferrobacterales bacterium]